MSYATQITVIAGLAGARTSHAFTLGCESSRHREVLRGLLMMDALDEIEYDSVNHGLEIDADEMTRALRRALPLFDQVEDEGLRQPLKDFAEFWFENFGKKSLLVFVELV